jgi:ABC-type antimicrobial peptide transport system permease subunit
MQGNKDEPFAKELASLPSVRSVSKSEIISSLGSVFGETMKYKDPLDSAQVDLNYIDENYLPLHEYKLLAGRNFTPKPRNAPESEAIVNQELIRRFNIGHNDPDKAIGQTITIDGVKLMIIGVLRDFHYGTLESKIEPAAFRYSADPDGYVNVKIETGNMPDALAGIEAAWKKIDQVHPLDAKFYDDQIKEAYGQFSVMVRVIGFFSFLAICIASLGMLGMVIYTMEKRLKEISIRKVLGASEHLLFYILSKGFLVLLCIAALIAIPLTWLFFDKVVLTNFAYHQPIQFGQVLIGLFIVAGISILIIGINTLKIVRANPAKVLKNE